MNRSDFSVDYDDLTPEAFAAKMLQEPDIPDNDVKEFIEDKLWRFESPEERHRYAAKVLNEYDRQLKLKVDKRNAETAMRNDSMNAAAAKFQCDLERWNGG